MLGGELVNIIVDRVKSIHQSDYVTGGTWFYTKGGIYKATADMS